MTTEFNLDDLFAKMESEASYEKVLYFPAKGDNVLLALLAPMEFNGEPKIAMQVEGEYKGEKNKQFILRCMMWKMVAGKPQDPTNPQFVGVVLSPSFIKQIASLRSKEYKFSEQTCHFLELKKAEKVYIEPRPSVKTLPDELWQKGMTSPTWEELLKAYEESKKAFAKKNAGKTGATATKDESNPWDE